MLRCYWLFWPRIDLAAPVFRGTCEVETSVCPGLSRQHKRLLLKGPKNRFSSIFSKFCPSTGSPYTICFIFTATTGSLAEPSGNEPKTHLLDGSSCLQGLDSWMGQHFWKLESIHPGIQVRSWAVAVFGDLILKWRIALFWKLEAPGQWASRSEIHRLRLSLRGVRRHWDCGRGWPSCVITAHTTAVYKLTYIFLDHSPSIFIVSYFLHFNTAATWWCTSSLFLFGWYSSNSLFFFLVLPRSDST